MKKVDNPSLLNHWIINLFHFYFIFSRQIIDYGNTASSICDTLLFELKYLRVLLHQSIFIFLNNIHSWSFVEVFFH